MSIDIKKARDFLKTHAHEGIKQYFDYASDPETLNRLTYHYEAPLAADHGDPCLITQYAYDGTSERIIKVKEYLGTWDSSYDI